MPGWVSVEDDPVKCIRYCEEQESGTTGLFGNRDAAAANDRSSTAYTEMKPEDAANQRRADAVAVQAAVAFGADVFVTERAYLQGATWPIASELTLCTVEEALPLLGLYLRAQNCFRLDKQYHCYKELYFWIAARDLLPQTWRWFTACVKHSTHVKNDDLTILSQTLMERVQRALAVRDQIHIALNQRQTSDTQFEALSNLDVVLVQLMGAADVAARVAHRVLGFDAAHEFNAAWQKEKWLKNGGEKASGLRDTVRQGSNGNLTLTILRLLRNSVHGAALEGVAFRKASSDLKTVVALPQKDHNDLLAAMNGPGGCNRWGMGLIQFYGHQKKQVRVSNGSRKKAEKSASKIQRRIQSWSSSAGIEGRQSDEPSGSRA